MKYLVRCACDHTLEQHHADGGCDRCTCARDGENALDAAIAAATLESTLAYAKHAKPRPDALDDIRTTTASERVARGPSVG